MCPMYPLTLQACQEREGGWKCGRSADCTWLRVEGWGFRVEGLRIWVAGWGFRKTENLHDRPCQGDKGSLVWGSEIVKSVESCQCHQQYAKVDIGCEVWDQRSFRFAGFFKASRFRQWFAYSETGEQGV